MDMRPKQPDFTPESEEWGKIILKDGTTIETRIILSDLTLISQDMLGTNFATSTVVAIRAKALQEIKEQMLAAPLSPLGVNVPITPEAGYEVIEIESIEKPTISIYSFDDQHIVLELEIIAVARNMKYKAPSGAPAYNIRWSVRNKIE